MVAFQHDLRRTFTDRGEIMFLFAFFAVLFLALAVAAFAASVFGFLEFKGINVVLGFVYFFAGGLLGAWSFIFFVHTVQLA